MFINVSYKSAMFFNLGIQHFLSFLFPFFPPFPLPLFFPFPLSSLLFSFPFLFLFFFPFSFSFSLSLSSSFPFLFSLPFPLFSFLSPFFPFPIFALLPNFWCRGTVCPPLPPHWLCPCYNWCMHGEECVNISPPPLSPLSVMRMNFDSPQIFLLCWLSAMLQTCQLSHFLILQK